MAINQDSPRQRSHLRVAQPEDGRSAPDLHELFAKTAEISAELAAVLPHGDPLKRPMIRIAAALDLRARLSRSSASGEDR